MEIFKALEYSDYELHVLEMWLANCRSPKLSISVWNSLYLFPSNSRL